MVAMQDETYVRDISTLRISDAEEAGGKGANMGELVAAKLPVPPGFVLLRDCYRDSMRAGGVDAELNALHREALANVSDTAHLPELCERLQGLVHKAGVSDAVRDSVLAAYRALGSDAVVAVRSSATGEDGRDASFAGMNATITNVSGEEALIDAVLRCWMSLFSPRVITYRASRDFTADPAMAVVVQQMINSEKAGVAFTADPSNGAQDRVVIEGAFGLGEVVVSGKVEPDTYIVSKETREVLDIRLGASGVQDRPRSGWPRQGGRPWTTCMPTPGCSTTTSCGASPSSRSPPSGTTAARRTPSGRSLTGRPTWCRPGPSPRCAIRGTVFRKARRAGPRTGGRAGNRVGQGARAGNPR